VRYLFGGAGFSEKALAAGIQPIIGGEAAVGENPFSSEGDQENNSLREAAAAGAAGAARAKRPAPLFT